MTDRRSPLRSLDGLFIAVGLCLVATVNACASDDDMTAERQRLLEKIEAEVRMTAPELGFARLDPRVAEAMLRVPRHAFVPSAQRALAYANHPLPIGGGQTISQPYIVAIMSQLLDVGPGDRVFELGTGSGYQAAVLADMGVEVYSVEIVPELAERAVANLQAAGYPQVQVRAGDGWLGWPEAAPFDGIILTAAAPTIPEQLIAQLKPGGRLVMPIGERNGVQQLAIFDKEEDGGLRRRDLLPVRFVPVTGPLGD
ncbi:protein-L-isoaspartate(D-aspartate) O-methyltransferase [Thiocapsa sp.]|uniref:protein-L-isoaspartate(D-aspartate) O-methyltransferase n=1 Tax=Thiocapsa sp. TaxID=2024551 RepID=UPI002C2EBC17|nr:protein-L-isoaspartate(D-aspartate) O-methyltransferase [Thiocapsa sp.]HSO82443.1 protein-L-isoaspartate(D-aspartate) O-methyltransferase [Thiocapsa sp.]